MPNENLSWGEVDIPDENVTEAEVTKAEAGGQIPPCVARCSCESSYPKEKVMTGYSCYAANLKWRVEEILEMPPGTPAKEEDVENYKGGFIYDDINLADKDEKTGMRNRRILVAKRCGLINSTSEKIPTSAWEEDIIEREVIIETELQKYTDKDDNKKQIIKVKFDGYRSTDTIVSDDDFDEI